MAISSGTVFYLQSVIMKLSMIRFGNNNNNNKSNIIVFFQIKKYLHVVQILTMIGGFQIRTVFLQKWI